jgi:hypothetical protein
MRRPPKLLSLVILIAAIAGLIEAQFHILRGPQILNQRELATRVLGSYLAEKYAGNKAVIFSNPFSQKSGQPREVYQFEKAGLRGLRRGLKPTVAIEAVVFPEIRPDFLRNPSAVFIDPATATPLSYVTTDTAWDTLIEQHPGAELIISLIGFPANLRQTKAWRESGKRFALLLPDLRMVGNSAAIRQAIETGKIAAIILNKPGAPPEDQPLGRDLKMEFDQRFLLVTSETVSPLLKAFPKLF